MFEKASKVYEKPTKKWDYYAKERKRSTQIVAIPLGKLMISVFEEKLVKKVNEKPYLGSKI